MSELARQVERLLRPLTAVAERVGRFGRANNGVRVVRRRVEVRSFGDRLPARRLNKRRARTAEVVVCAAQKPAQTLAARRVAV